VQRIECRGGMPGFPARWTRGCGRRRWVRHARRCGVRGDRARGGTGGGRGRRRTAAKCRRRCRRRARRDQGGS
jgi:hypothetical protein